jgi:2-dehydro-3-deoxy-D-gluconate 5-dehydrogenase
MDVSRFSLEGKTALVTGASSGIGQAIAVGLAGAGADVVLAGHQSKLQETAEMVKKTGRQAHSYLLDLEQPEQLEAGCQAILTHHRIDILVNSAGTTIRKPALGFTLEEWQKVLNVNMNSAFILIQQFAGPMLERHAGKIINIASLSSFQGGITVVPYTASKHGIAGITKALANEWAAQGLQINAIAPGYIETNLTRPLMQNETRNQAILARIPTGRWGKPEDLIGAAIFLASSASDYVNGQVLAVDGGWMAW